jgi:adenosylhomocysteine nucleosidase
MILILTALGLEHAAFRPYLVAAKDEIHDSISFDIGTLRGHPRLRVALAEIGTGNSAATMLADSAIRTLKPTAVLLVGIAGALKPWLALGDVAVSKQIYSYHGGRAEDDQFLAHPRTYEVRDEVVQAAMLTRRDGVWLNSLPHKANLGRVPTAYLAPIAAGEVVLDSLTSPEAERLRQHYNDAIAVEMESAGVARATRRNKDLPMCAVRGISDAANGTKGATDEKGWQPIAAANAAAFAAALVVRLEQFFAAANDDPATEPTAKQPRSTDGDHLTTNIDGNITTYGSNATFGPTVNR